MILLLIGAAGALVLAAVALRRAPLATVLALCAVGGAIHLGVVSVPAAITTPIARASDSVRSWQASQSAKLVCAAGETRALENDDAAALQSVDDSCQPATP